MRGWEGWWLVSGRLNGLSTAWIRSSLFSSSSSLHIIIPFIIIIYYGALRPFLLISISACGKQHHAARSYTAALYRRRLAIILIGDTVLFIARKHHAPSASRWGIIGLAHIYIRLYIYIVKGFSTFHHQHQSLCIYIYILRYLYRDNGDDVLLYVYLLSTANRVGDFHRRCCYSWWEWGSGLPRGFGSPRMAPATNYNHHQKVIIIYITVNIYCVILNRKNHI